jgi:hypothetical protein
MYGTYIIPALATLLFVIFKIVEMKLFAAEKKPLKFLVRDALIVFACAFIASYIMYSFGGSVDDFLNVITDTNIIPKSADVFVDKPDF